MFVAGAAQFIQYPDIDGKVEAALGRAGGIWEARKIAVLAESFGADWIVGWKADGSEIYYMDLQSSIVKVGLSLGEDLVADIPEGNLAARIHSSIDGTVASVSGAITIEQS